MALVQLVEKSLWNATDTLADARRALAAAPAIEIDARLSADGRFVVAHGPMSPSGKPILQTPSADLGDLVDLETVLNLVADQPGKRLVMEIKTLGRLGGQDDVAARLAALVKSARLADRVSVSSLSPAVLLAVHRAWPEVPLILNGALAPVVSYPDGPFGRFLVKRITSGRGYWRAAWRGRGVVLGSTDGALRAAREHEAAAAQGETIYVLTSLSADLADTLRAQPGAVLGGAVSIASVTAWCNVLLRVGLRRLPARLSQRIVRTVHAQGLNVQTTTWGAINRPARVRAWRPEAQILRLLRDGLGAHDVIYTRGVGPALLTVVEDQQCHR